MTIAATSAERAGSVASVNRSNAMASH